MRIIRCLSSALLACALIGVSHAYAQAVATNIAYAKRDISPLDYYPDDTDTYYQVRGRITSPHFATNGSEFFIQDTNDNVGIRVDSTTLRPELTLYTELEVIGKISQTAGVRRIMPDFSTDLWITDPNPVPVQPVPGTISTFLANPEAYEGTYVVISNLYAPTNAAFPWGSSVSVTVTDLTGRITMRVDVDMDIDGQLAPTNPFVLYGIFSQFDTSATPTGGYQVLPRFYADIVQATEPQPPRIFVVNSNALFSVIVSNNLSVTLIAQDRNPEDNLTLSLVSAPAGAAIQLQTQRVWRLTWTPDGTFENTTNSITVAVTDDTFTNEVVLQVYVLPELIGNVRINEIHWDPAPGKAGDASGDGITDATRDEFIEIVNANTSEVDITGWKLYMGNYLLFTFPPTVLTGRTAAVVFGGPTATGAFGHSVVYFPTSNWAGLSNNPGTNSVRLVTDGGAEVSSYNYAAFGTPDMSLTRNPDFTGDFVLQTGVVPFVRWTPGTMANGKYFEGTGRTNSPPLLAIINDRSVIAGNALSVNFEAYDPEGNTITLFISNAPSTAVFIDNGNGTATLSYTGLVSDIGVFNITVYASDGIEEPVARSFLLTVLNAQYAGLTLNEICFNPSTTYDANEDGVVSGTADEFVEIVNNTTGTLDLTGFMIYDSVGLRHRFSSVIIPTGGAVVVFGGTNIFNFWRSPAQIASSGQLGLNNNPPESVVLYDPTTNEIVRFELTVSPPVGASLARVPDLSETWDNHYLATTNTLRGSPGRRLDGTLFYTNVPPVWDRASNITVTISNAVNFSVFARAYDADTITLTASNLPAGATFSNTPSVGLTTGAFYWATAAPAGVYTCVFYAVDKDGTVSTSIVITVASTPVPPAEVVVWINEIHYDNSGTDIDEGVEIAGTAGADLSDYTLYFYNGSTGPGGSQYGMLACSGTIDDEGCGYGAVWFPYSGIQNGPTDGVALVRNSDTSVVQFLSYEGTMIATNGPAAGYASTDIGVFQPGNETNLLTLQLTGTGTNYADFMWVGPTNHSRGSLNADQFIAGCGTLDQDGDGIPDDWETLYFGCATCAVANADSDGDGFSNLEEYLADTIPVGPAGSNSYFVIDRLTNTTTRYIQFLSSTGRLYTLQGTSDPRDDNSWSNLSGEVYGTGDEMSLSDTSAAERAFYRIRVRKP